MWSNLRLFPHRLLAITLTFALLASTVARADDVEDGDDEDDDSTICLLLIEQPAFQPKIVAQFKA